MIFCQLPLGELPNRYTPSVKSVPDTLVITLALNTQPGSRATIIEAGAEVLTQKEKV